MPTRSRSNSAPGRAGARPAGANEHTFGRTDMFDAQLLLHKLTIKVHIAGCELLL